MEASMSMPIPSSTASAPSSTFSQISMNSTGDIRGGHGDSPGCKISMLWNWYTIDSCFLSSSWRNTSTAMFAGSCIGMILLVIFLEFVRRMGKEYDSKILRDHQIKYASLRSSGDSTNSGKRGSAISGLIRGRSDHVHRFRPNMGQQLIRACLHMLAFAVAYMIMLIAMYYNGYIIICIFIGAFIGFFIFGWESVSLGGPREDSTVCCG